MKDIAIARPKKRVAILVCRKCLKRIPKGKRLPRSLKNELSALAARGLRKPRLVKTSCFGICPKRAVVATNGAHLARGEYLLIDGTSIEAAAAALSDDPVLTLPQGELRAAE